LFGRGPAVNRWSPIGESSSGLYFPRERKGELGSLRRFAKRKEAAVAAERSPSKQHEKSKFLTELINKRFYEDAKNIFTDIIPEYFFFRSLLPK